MVGLSHVVKKNIIIFIDIIFVTFTALIII